MSASARDNGGQRTTKGVVAFDLDGTLLPSSTICLHLAPWLGHDDLPRLEELYARGEISNTEVAKRDALFYEGRTRADVWEQLEDLPLIDGIAETVQELSARSLAPVVATVTQRIAAAFLAERFGFVDYCGLEMEEVDGVFTGRIVQPIGPDEKCEFVRSVASKERLRDRDIVAVGDSWSDIPLFESAGLAIALNASEHARKAADVELDTDDLRDVIPHIDRHFSRT